MQTSPVEILATYWKHSSFRPLQEDIVQSVLSGSDTLALLPTGGGKSVCFQVPAMAMEGVCIVVTPLVALMRDQVMQLKSKGITAAHIDASLHRKEIDLILENTRQGAYKFLYISPERIKTALFFEKMRNAKVCLFAIDEAHCISQWGYDFRPSYLEIHTLREMKPGVPMIALTATATARVKQDIVDKLQLVKPNIFVKSFARDNLSYSCFREEDKQRKLLEILQKVPGSSVVYVRSRLRCKEIAGFLRKNNIGADFYHAGLSPTERATKQDYWIKNRTRVMVATNAFGMGIDKPDVRTVVHVDLPESPEAYYQEAGRAGRDGQKAYCVALFNESDLDELQHRQQEQFPEIDFIKKVYQALANYLQVATGSADALFNFDIDDFQKYMARAKEENSAPRSVYYALKSLEQQGFILLNESFYTPSSLYVPDHSVLYQFQIANARFDPFIKVLLRMYGGQMYSGFVNISESGMARQLKINEADLVQLLDNLHKAGIVVYKPRNDKPQIAFLKDRYEAARLPFDQVAYKERRQIMEEKTGAMRNYVSHAERCRSQMLLEYFGEINEQVCGVCDNCIKNKKKDKDQQQQTEAAMQAIRQALQHTLLPEELWHMLPALKKNIFLGALQALVESGEVKYDGQGKIYRNLAHQMPGH